MSGSAGDALRPVSKLISRLRSIQPVGRLILDVDPLLLKSDPNKNIILEDGDALYIPKRPSSINVVGEVYSPSSHSFDSSVSIQSYVRKAGGLRNTADTSNMYVILPNGESSPITMRGKALFKKNQNLPTSHNKLVNCVSKCFIVHPRMN